MEFVDYLAVESMNRICTIKNQRNKTVQISSNMNIFFLISSFFSQWVNLMISSEFLLQPKKYRKVNIE